MSDVTALLRGAEAARSKPLESAAAIQEALAAAPHDIDVRLAAYRFYFYSHQYGPARQQADAILRHAARQLNLASDWRDVLPDHADFTAHAFGPGLYLQALVALGYCAARLGDMAQACEVLSKAAELDPSDRFGGTWLLDKVIKGPEDLDDDT